MHRRIERQSGMTGNMAKRHIHRITVLDREHLIIRQLQATVPLNKAFGYRQEFDPELRTRLCPVVDNPHIAPLIRVNIVMGKFLYIGIGQSREAAEYEDITYNGSFIIGNLHVHDRLQFRFGQETAVAILTRHSKSCERVRCDPAVLKGRIAHQLQFLYRIGQCSR